MARRDPYGLRSRAACVVLALLWPFAQAWAQPQPGSVPQGGQAAALGRLYIINGTPVHVPLVALEPDIDWARAPGDGMALPNRTLRLRWPELVGGTQAESEACQAAFPGRFCPNLIGMMLHSNWVPVDENDEGRAHWGPPVLQEYRLPNGHLLRFFWRSPEQGQGVAFFEVGAVRGYCSSINLAWVRQPPPAGEWQGIDAPSCTLPNRPLGTNLFLSVYFSPDRLAEVEEIARRTDELALSFLRSPRP